MPRTILPPLGVGGVELGWELNGPSMINCLPLALATILRIFLMAGTGPGYWYTWICVLMVRALELGQRDEHTRRGCPDCYLLTLDCHPYLDEPYITSSPPHDTGNDLQRIMLYVMILLYDTISPALATMPWPLSKHITCLGENCPM